MVVSLKLKRVCEQSVLRSAFSLDSPSTDTVSGCHFLTAYVKKTQFLVISGVLKSSARQGTMDSCGVVHCRKFEGAWKIGSLRMGHCDKHPATAILSSQHCDNSP